MTTNHELFQRALARMPGGVNSPVRAFKSVGGEPFFTARADGAYLFDVEGTRYIDYVGSWGPMIVGHNHPHVRAAVERAIERRTLVRHAVPGRSHDGRDDRAAGAVDRRRAHGQLRHRSDDVGDPSRARLHGPYAHREVRRAAITATAMRSWSRRVPAR